MCRPATNLSFRDAVAGSDRDPRARPTAAHHHADPAGVRDGQKIRLRGKGARGDAGRRAGDLMLTVTVEKHPVFGRDGDNLTVDLPVTFAEAALGATVSVPTLDGDAGPREGRAGHAERSRAAGQGSRREAGRQER